MTPEDFVIRFEIVYPAAGSPNSAVKLTLEELEKASRCKEGWMIQADLSSYILQ